MTRITFITLGALLAVAAPACATSGKDEGAKRTPASAGAMSAPAAAAMRAGHEAPSAKAGVTGPTASAGVATQSGKAGVAARSAKAGVTITTRNINGFGRVLVDGRGLPLYIFTADRGKRSRCYGACAKAWPVTYAGGSPRAAGGAKQALLGTTRRSDGRRQVTYRGRPLYYYVHDRPGVALCHNVREFGGLWLLVRSNGRRV
jgi:predicted lipoprotein with Yx(FWY)xxD motif